MNKKVVIPITYGNLLMNIQSNESLKLMNVNSGLNGLQVHITHKINNEGKICEAVYHNVVTFILTNNCLTLTHLLGDNLKVSASVITEKELMNEIDSISVIDSVSHNNVATTFVKSYRYPKS